MRPRADTLSLRLFLCSLWTTSGDTGWALHPFPSRPMLKTLHFTSSPASLHGQRDISRARILLPVCSGCFSCRTSPKSTLKAVPSSLWFPCFHPQHCYGMQEAASRAMSLKKTAQPQSRGNMAKKKEVTVSYRLLRMTVGRKTTAPSRQPGAREGQSSPSRFQRRTRGVRWCPATKGPLGRRARGKASAVLLLPPPCS